MAVSTVSFAIAVDANTQTPSHFAFYVFVSIFKKKQQQKKRHNFTAYHRKLLMIFFL